MFTELADWLVYDLKGLSPDTPFGAALHFFVMDITKIFTMLFVLLFAVGILRSYIDNDRLKQWFERRNRFVAYGAAAVLGIITPFCSCSSIPLFLGFVAAQIPLGVAMAFLITSPMINEVALILFGQSIGVSFAVAYLAAGVGVGMLGGWLADYLKLDRWLSIAAADNNTGTACSCQSGRGEKDIIRYHRLRFAWAETRRIVAKIWGYVVLGVALGAGMHGYVPQEWLTSHIGTDNLLAVPLAVLAGVPLYANVTGLVPIAEVLIAKGLPVGTTLAFIMGTATLSIPELLILRNVMQWRLLTAFVIFLAGAFIILGYVFNALF